MAIITGIISSSINKLGGGAVIVSDADAQTFVTNAGILIQAQGNAIDNFVIALKGYSVWNKLMLINIKVGGTASQHKWNLKDPRDLDAAYRYVYGGTWTHSSSGAVSNGSTSYANTFLNLITLGLTGNFSFGYYLTVAPSAFGDKHSMGGYSSGSNWSGIQHNSSTQLLAMSYAGSGTSYPLNITAPSNGFHAMSVNGTTKKIYHKGVSASYTVNGTIAPNVNFYEGALNLSNSYYNGVAATFGTSFIGVGLTDTEIGNLQTAIIAFETALGRSV